MYSCKPKRFYLQGDGREEVVACAWDGQTYIIDHNRTVVRFQFDENVNAFCAGERPLISHVVLFIRFDFLQHAHVLNFGSGNIDIFSTTMIMVLLTMQHQLCPVPSHVHILAFEVIPLIFSRWQHWVADGLSSSSSSVLLNLSAIYEQAQIIWWS